MSVRQVQAVFAASRSRNGARLVALALGWKDTDRGAIEVSLDELARLTGLDRSAVTRALGKLIQLGEVRRLRGGGRGRRSVYQLVVGQLSLDLNRCETHQFAETGADCTNNRCETHHVKTRRQERESRESRLPPDLRERVDLAFIREFGCLSPAKAFAAFCAHARTHGRRCRDWAAAWEQWAMQHDARCPCMAEVRRTGRRLESTKRKQPHASPPRAPRIPTAAEVLGAKGMR